MNSNELDLMKEKFNAIVKNCSLKLNSAVLTKEKYASLMIDVKKMKIKKESSRDYWLEKHYDIVKINDIEKLILNEGDPRSFNVVVLKLTDDGFYQLGCNNRVLKQLYSQSQFTVCSKNFLALDAVPNESVTLRFAATAQSLETGQFFKSALVPKNVIQSDVFVEKTSIVQL